MHFLTFQNSIRSYGGDSLELNLPKGSLLNFLLISLSTSGCAPRDVTRNPPPLRLTVGNLSIDPLDSKRIPFHKASVLLKCLIKFTLISHSIL